MCYVRFVVSSSRGVLSVSSRCKIRFPCVLGTLIPFYIVPRRHRKPNEASGIHAESRRRWQLPRPARERGMRFDRAAYPGPLRSLRPPRIPETGRSRTRNPCRKLRSTPIATPLVTASTTLIVSLWEPFGKALVGQLEVGIQKDGFHQAVHSFVVPLKMLRD